MQLKANLARCSPCAGIQTSSTLSDLFLDIIISSNIPSLDRLS